jgi:hypothetical protein
MSAIEEGRKRGTLSDMLYYTWHSEANVKSRLRMAIQSWLHV